MRVELNISISDDPAKFGTKVEVKNINSFRAVERAAEFEIKRMAELLDAGKGAEIVQETRGWDEAKQRTFSQRSKEDSHDYRYFPDPDIPKLYLSEIFDIPKLQAELPELPEAKRIRYAEAFGIKDEDIEVYVNDVELSVWFESIAKILNDKEKIRVASNYITSDFIGLRKNNPDAVKMSSVANSAELITMVTDGAISSRGAKDILSMIVINDESPRKIAEEKGLIQKNDPEALKLIVQKVIDENPQVVADFKGGKEAAIMGLVGKVMKESNGSANPQLAKQLLLESLK